METLVISDDNKSVDRIINSKKEQSRINGDGFVHFMAQRPFFVIWEDETRVCYKIVKKPSDGYVLHVFMIISSEGETIYVNEDI